MHERTCAAGELDLPRGQGVPGVEVPQLQGDDLADLAAGEPRASGRPRAGLTSRSTTSWSARSGPRAASAYPIVSRSATASSRTSTARCGPGPGGAARAASAASRTPPGMPMSLAQMAAPRASRCAVRARPTSTASSRRAAPSSNGAASVAAPLVKGDLPAQLLHLRDLQLVQWAGLDRDQQPQGRIQAPGIALGPRRGEQPLRPAAGCGGEQRRPLQERGRRGQPATTLRPARRPFQFRGNVLVRPGRGLGPVPRAAVGIELRIGDLRQGSVHGLPVPADADR